MLELLSEIPTASMLIFVRSSYPPPKNVFLCKLYILLELVVKPAWRHTRETVRLVVRFRVGLGCWVGVGGSFAIIWNSRSRITLDPFLWFPSRSLDGTLCNGPRFARYYPPRYACSNTRYAGPERTVSSNFCMVPYRMAYGVPYGEW